MTLTKLIQQLIARIKVLLVRRSAPRMKGLKPVVKRMAEQVIVEMFNRGHTVMVFQGYRSPKEQDYLYAQGRTRSGPIITNAKAGQSLHNYGVAVDIVFTFNGQPSWDNSHPWSLLGQVGKDVGFEWGGDWKGFVDRPHFQYLDKFALSDFQAGIVDNKRFA